MAAHTRHKKHEYTLDNIPEGMPTEVVEHRLEGDELVCPKCGDTMTEIGVEVVKRLKIEPIRLVVRNTVTTLTPAGPATRRTLRRRLLKHPGRRISSPQLCHTEAIAHIMTQKFVMAVRYTDRSRSCVARVSL